MRGRPAAALALALLSGACAGAPTSAADGDRVNCEWQVCVRWRDAANGRLYSVTNGGPVPATVRLTPRTIQNLRIPETLPIEKVVPARSAATLVFLEIVDREATFGVVGSVSIDLGASDTRPDDHLYGMPFGGTEPRPLVQGFNGSDSHMVGMRWALDFGMPAGTPIVAARAGTVVHVQDGFTAGGIDESLLDRANLVMVGHADGTMASYGHLSPGIVVAVGDAVEEGQLLGHSGATGFAGSPHLHFHVGVRALGDPGRTIRVRMKDGAGREVELRTGRSYDPSAERRDD